MVIELASERYHRSIDVYWCRFSILDDLRISRSRIKIRRRTKCQSKQQNIIRKPPNIMSTRLAIIRKQRNTMRPAIPRKPCTMLMLHTDTIYRQFITTGRQFITTRRQQNSISSITARSRTRVREKATIEIVPQSVDSFFLNHIVRATGENYCFLHVWNVQQ